MSISSPPFCAKYFLYQAFSCSVCFYHRLQGGRLCFALMERETPAQRQVNASTPWTRNRFWSTWLPDDFLFTNRDVYSPRSLKIDFESNIDDVSSRKRIKSVSWSTGMSFSCWSFNKSGGKENKIPLHWIPWQLAIVSSMNSNPNNRWMTDNIYILSHFISVFAWVWSTTTRNVKSLVHRKSEQKESKWQKRHGRNVNVFIYSM